MIDKIKNILSIILGVYALYNFAINLKSILEIYRSAESFAYKLGYTYGTLLWAIIALAIAVLLRVKWRKSTHHS